MKKRLVSILAVLLIVLPLGAGVMNDVSFTFGHQAGLANPDGLNLYYGMNLGLSGRLEASLYGESALTPSFFGDSALGLSFSFALLGPRNTGTSVPGNAINTLLNAGVLFSMHNPWNLFVPTTAYVSITPITLGSPVLGRRERILEMGLAYNWAENSFSFFFSCLKMDYYAKGSWRDFV